MRMCSTRVVSSHPHRSQQHINTTVGAGSCPISTYCTQLILRHLHLLVGAATQLNSTQLDSTRLNSTFSCRVVIINSISIFLDFVGLHVLSYAHVDSSTASHRHCVQRGGLICKCIQRHPPPLTLITLHNFHTATPRLRKRLLTNRRASTLFVAPFPRGTLSKSRQ